MVLKALQKEPEDRYSDADHFADDLERVRTGAMPRPGQLGGHPGGPAFVRRHDQLVVAGVVMLVMASAAGWFFGTNCWRHATTSC